MNQGDLVTRKSYGSDIVFRVEQIDAIKGIAILRGVDFRLLADSPINDLEAWRDTSVESVRSRHPQVTETLYRLSLNRALLQEQQHLGWKEKVQPNAYYFEVPGKVLHLDGDQLYLRKSMNVYGEMRIPADGFYMPESQMATALEKLLPQLKPDIVVITGHDGILKNRSEMDIHDLNSYKNSIHFVKAVQVARKYERNRDALTIVAGACQSHFEALLQAGSNFASSPARILIHALDPVSIAARMSFSSVKDTVSMLDIMDVTVTGLEGMGGVETRGSYRTGIPRVIHGAKPSLQK
jgi:spore coat assemly protein